MRRNVTRIAVALTLGYALGGLIAPGQAVGQETDDLAAAAQNPIASMISLPLQNNTFFGIEPDDKTSNQTLIQPVYPLSLGEDWNVITRAIIPFIYIEGFFSGDPYVPNAVDEVGSQFGMGDINFSGFFSPKKPLDLGNGKLTWGVGPSITAPTSTDSSIGSEKWSAGPSVIGVFIKKPWVAGALFQQLWSFAGDDNRQDVSQLLIQPFVNYNLPKGWYLVTSPIITANWRSDSDNRWSVPIGGGVGKIFNIGSQPVNAQVQGFYNAVQPTGGADWSLRLQLTFLFPT